LGGSGKPGWLKIQCTRQHLVYADDVNIWGKSVYTKKKNTEALVVGSKETRLEVNADETEYTAMSQDQNAGQSHSIKIDNNPLKWWNISNLWEQP
jgi:hypothetical protein